MIQIRDSAIDFLSQAFVFDILLFSCALKLALCLNLFSCLTLAGKQVTKFLNSLTFVLMPAAFEQHQNAFEL